VECKVQIKLLLCHQAKCVPQWQRAEARRPLGQCSAGKYARGALGKLSKIKTLYIAISSIERAHYLTSLRRLQQLLCNLWQQVQLRLSYLSSYEGYAASYNG